MSNIPKWTFGLAFLLGFIGFVGGFFGPAILTPEANQGPLLGIFFTGPAGVVLGAAIGAVIDWYRYTNR